MQAPAAQLPEDKGIPKQEEGGNKALALQQEEEEEEEEDEGPEEPEYPMAHLKGGDLPCNSPSLL